MSRRGEPSPNVNDEVGRCHDVVPAICSETSLRHTDQKGTENFTISHVVHTLSLSKKWNTFSDDRMCSQIVRGPPRSYGQRRPWLTFASCSPVNVSLMISAHPLSIPSQRIVHATFTGKEDMSDPWDYCFDLK